MDPVSSNLSTLCMCSLGTWSTGYLLSAMLPLVLTCKHKTITASVQKMSDIKTSAIRLVDSNACLALVARSELFVQLRTLPESMFGETMIFCFYLPAFPMEVFLHCIDFHGASASNMQKLLVASIDFVTLGSYLDRNMVLLVGQRKFTLRSFQGNFWRFWTQEWRILWPPSSHQAS